MFRGASSFHAAVVAGAMLTAAAPGSSVVPMSVGTMADHAGQVIAGDVTAVRSYRVDEPWRIETEVTFAAVEYLKGAPAQADGSFTLRVPGGTIGDLQVRIEGAPRFVVGETWVLFLLPTYKTFPVVGIQQGAFRVVRAPDGTDRVYRAGRPVGGIDDRGLVQVETAPEAAPDTAMTYEGFVNAVAPVLAASRDHELTEAAGRPAPVRSPAVPLQRAVPKREVRR